MMKENYNTPNSGCCGRPMSYAPENKCNYNDCCMNEYAYKQKACIREKQPDCEAQAVIPSITVETIDGITNLANCLVHVTSTNTTYYVDDKHRIMITWAGPVNIPGYDMESNPNHYKNQIVTDTQAETAVIYDNNGNGYIFGITSSNLQTAVNNKLDEMASDGTLSNIIAPLLEPFEEEIREEIAGIGDLTQLETVKKDSLVNAVNSANQNYIGLLREKYGNNYLPVDIYENIGFFKENVVIYKDQFSNNYSCYCDLSKHKNSGGTNIYVDPSTDVPSAQQDGTESKPYDKVSTAYTNATNGDTILLADGFYNRTQTGNFNFTKSVNIVAKSGEPNKVFCMVTDSLTWTADATYTNVYSTTRSNTMRVIDIRKRNDDCLPQLIRVSSLIDCSTTLNSYYINGATVYVNIGEIVTDDKVRCAISVTSPFRIQNNNADTNVYFENITFIGGTAGFVSVTGSGTYKCQLTAKNCNFYYTKGDDYDAISIVGADAIFVNCKACFGNKDGFNYHLTGTRYPHVIEINCVGANNGLERTSASTSNGSTSHAQCKVLRFGGVYFNNNGSNVCDVGTNNVTINIMCKSFDSASYANTAINKNDFGTQDVGSIMKLYNCYSKGSNSRVNIYAHADSTVEVNHCFYDTTAGTGTLIINQ